MIAPQQQPEHETEQQVAGAASPAVHSWQIGNTDHAEYNGRSEHSRYSEHALQPSPATGQGSVRGRLLGGWNAWALRPRALWLLLAGVLGLVPAFFLHLRWSTPWLAMLAWDLLVLTLAAWELHSLPLTVRITRTVTDTPALGQPTKIELAVSHDGNHSVMIIVTDALHPTLSAEPIRKETRVYARQSALLQLEVQPKRRGDYRLGAVYCRLRGSLGLAERWLRAELQQTVRVYPGAVRAGSEGELPLVSARQLEMEKRRMRQRGLGREFQSLREYQPGDALRDLSWTATARRGKLIARQFTTERSQQVWVLLDAGRLSGTTAVRDGVDMSQLDAAADAAVLLARAVTGVGDKFGLMAYGRTVRQQLLPGKGAGHLRVLVDLLSQVVSERGEANHLRAAARLKQLQRRRAMVVWVTEVAESAGRPEIAVAIAELSRHHLPLVLLLEDPELQALADAQVETAEQMYATAAAREMEERRRALVLQLERGGALVARTTRSRLAADAIRGYLDVKARGLL
jgi:uncharacterized protein (DUF58 family)